jgi:phosphoglycolate phosphatase
VNDTELECRLVLFDLDGTLIDAVFGSKSLAKARMAQIKEIAGIEAANRWAELSGVNTKTFEVDQRGPLSKAPRKEDLIVAAAAIWLNKMKWFKAKEIAVEAYTRADVQLSSGYKPKMIKGVEQALRNLKKAGLLLGIATNGSGKTAFEMMKALGIVGLFDVITGADEVEEGKPSPEMILLACRRLDVEPLEAVYVGDEETDTMAGDSANVKATIIVDVDDSVLDPNIIKIDSVAKIFV